MKKNTATKIVFPILDADGDLVTGAAGLDSEYSLDGGAFADCANEATEISGGVYYLNLAQGETNGDVVCIQVKTSTSGAKTTVLVFYTAAQTLDETDVVCDAIKTKTDGLNFTGTYVDAQVKALSDIDLSATMKTSVNTEVDDALNTAVPEIPTSDSINERIKTLDDNYTNTKASYLDVAISSRSSHTPADVWSYTTRDLSDYSGVWAVGTRALTDKVGFSLAADQSGVTIGAVNIVGQLTTNNDKTGYALSTAGVDAILDDAIEGTITARQALRLILSASAAKSSGGGTNTITFRDANDTKNRIVATVDSDGNRTAVSLTGT